MTNKGGSSGLNRLSALAVKRLRKPGRYADGGGLYLDVDRNGNKRWALRLAADGRRRDFGLGPIHKVSLQSARAAAADYRSKVYAGIDPLAEKRARRQKAIVPTFRQAAEAVYAGRKATWSNGKHVDQWINSLQDYAFPVIGTKPVNEVGTPDVLKVLTPIWVAKPETARRVRQRIKTILDWARAAGHRSGDNPVDLIGDALPRKAGRVEHHAALAFNEVGAFVRALRGGKAEPVTKLGFELLILTAVRSQEVRGAAWGEIDLAQRLWTIPAMRMKARRDHIVPLCDRCMTILSEARHLPQGPAGSELVFPDPSTGRALSENRFLNARDAIGYAGRCTPHGFRSSFRDWAAETTTFPSEVVEMALAHAISSKTEAAYRRGDLLTKRRGLMAAWSTYVLATPKAST